MKKISLYVLIFSIGFYFLNYEFKLIHQPDLFYTPPKQSKVVVPSSLIPKVDSSLLCPVVYYKPFVDEAKEFCKENDFNEDFFFLLDYRKHSGKKRFYIYDFKKNKIVNSLMVSHGCGNKLWSSDETKNMVRFSNVSESYCSSKGKYKIGKRGWSNWGININYRLHGLDSTNSNAFERQVILHSWGLVTEDEVYPEGTSEGHGCPAVNNEAMYMLDSLLKIQKKETLLWVIG